MTHGQRIVRLLKLGMMVLLASVTFAPAAGAVLGGDVVSAIMAGGAGAVLSAVGKAVTL